MFIVSLALAAIVSAGPGPTQDVVDAAIVVAQAHAAAGDYDQALNTVREARRLSDHRDLIVVEAQILRLSGDCKTAVDLYREFIETDPPEQDRRFAESNLHACSQAVLLAEADEHHADDDCPGAVDRYRKFLEGQPSAEERKTVLAKVQQCEQAQQPEDPESTIIGPTEPPEQTPPPVVDTPPRPALDRVGIALWIGGGVVTVAGVSMFGAAWAQRGRSQRDMPTLDTYLDRERNARTLGAVGIAAMTTGVSVLIAATVRHVVLKRRKASR